MSDARDSDGSESWALICAGTEYFKDVPFPRKNPRDGLPVCFLKMRLLTAQEIGIATARAHQRTAEAIRQSDPGYTGPIDRNSRAYTDLFENYAAIEQLKLACRDPKDTSRTFFPMADVKHAPKTALEAVLVQDEIAALYKELVILRVELSPIRYQLTEAELEAWWSRLEKGEDRNLFLSQLSLELIVQLVPPLVGRLQALLQSKSASTTA